MHLVCRRLSGRKARWRHDHGVCRWNRDARVRRWAHSLTDSRLAERGIPALALSSVRCTRRRGSLARRLLPHSNVHPLLSTQCNHYYPQYHPATRNTCDKTHLTRFFSPDCAASIFLSLLADRCNLIGLCGHASECCTLHCSRTNCRSNYLHFPGNLSI